MTSYLHTMTSSSTLSCYVSTLMIVFCTFRFSPLLWRHNMKLYAIMSLWRLHRYFIVTEKYGNKFFFSKGVFRNIISLYCFYSTSSFFLFIYLYFSSFFLLSRCFCVPFFLLFFLRFSEDFAPRFSFSENRCLFCFFLLIFFCVFGKFVNAWLNTYHSVTS